MYSNEQPVGECDDVPLWVCLHPAALGHPAADAFGVDQPERLDVATVAAHPQYATQVIDLISRNINTTNIFVTYMAKITQLLHPH